MDQIDDILTVLADPVRWSALQYLSKPENRRTAPCGCGIRASDLTGALGVSQPTVSHHMRRLVGARVVREIRRSRCVFYELDADTLGALADGFGRLAADARVDATP
ncbi:MAG: transcriptional regulator [Trueperaceae bacterium]|nr:MAG: transcriptional regulator [Trueperaceae bacterium]